MIFSLLTWFRNQISTDTEDNAGEPSKNVAKKRLSFLLLQDRINLPPPKLEALKRDLLKVLSNYVEVESENIEISIEQLPASRKMAIVSNIPVRGVVADSQEKDSTKV